ncbi:DeoR/GlpR transcriptional regulator [Mycolicibacterium sp. CH28]|uniref:DeoR/GlpR family DNA-binding transcription regulator n=1 Tax=Mycolicibacterium sp. CH28 TaxID=2512237 RepID=UPI001080018F|nr:DeoR/GlpR family DNA-binding transcription regulator [Mycolicibacterium sp. CH28]TGD86688.1 DeoR/GlpR transcriptional regulator [Mycolicibacterium sp. CH28]
MKAERLGEILDRLGEGGSVDVVRLADEFQVSPATIRRDLQSLHEQGLVRRTHGGALPNPAGLEMPIRYKASRQLKQKRAIGIAAAALVHDGDVVGITGGTTATEVARALAERRNLTVVTNALNIAAELISRPNIRLVVVGGKARHASYELVGPAAEAMIAQYHFDIAFVGADGFTVAGGCTTHDEMEAHTDLAFIQQAARTVLVADSSKIGKVTFARICGPDMINTLVTDSGIAEVDRSAAEARNLEVIAAGAK